MADDVRLRLQEYRAQRKDQQQQMQDAHATAVVPNGDSISNNYSLLNDNNDGRTETVTFFPSFVSFHHNLLILIPCKLIFADIYDQINEQTC